MPDAPNFSMSYAENYFAGYFVLIKNVNVLCINYNACDVCLTQHETRYEILFDDFLCIIDVL